MRNDLLAKIVVASGGTVTNKDNRNELLLDWLSAVDNPPEPSNYVARPDGVSQYWLLTSPIGIPLGGKVEIDINYLSTSVTGDDYLFCSSSSTATAMFQTGVSEYGVGSSGQLSSGFTVDGVRTNTVPYDNVFRTISVESTGFDTEIAVIGARFNFIRSTEAALKNFRVYDASGVLINEIPLTNKDQGATQLATVGGVDATMPNYTPEAWEVDNASQ